MRLVVHRALQCLAATTLLAGILGMGALGGGSEGGAPMRDFRARLTDVDGGVVELTHVNVGGTTMLDGDLGRGRLRIPFDRIERIEFAPSNDRDRLRATLTLRDGDPATMLVRSSATFYGQLPSGAYQIRARDLRTVQFRPETSSRVGGDGESGTLGGTRGRGAAAGEAGAAD